MSENYFLLFKTADAEKRAWRNLATERKKALFPIIELTRGKQNRGAGKNAEGKPLTAEELRNTGNIYGFKKNYRSTLDLMKPCEEVFVDLTREPSLSCFETDQLSTSTDGYAVWVKLLIDLQSDWPNVLPTLIVNPSEDEDEAKYGDNLRGQFDALAARFKKILYRVSVLEDSEFIYDIALLSERIGAFVEDGGTFYVALDHEYIRPRNGQVHAKRTSQIISSVLEAAPSVEVICLATSFPKSVTDIGYEEYHIFPVEESYLFDVIASEHKNVQYGDYGSINPIRNDEIIITQGWRPRIDYVSAHKGLQTYYFREKRDVLGKDSRTSKNILAPYSRHYRSVAAKICQHSPYYEDLPMSWGCDEIKSTAQGDVPSNSPSHWISVRMEIHIVRLLRHLKLDPI